MFTPGADKSGLVRLLPSAMTGPRLLKPAMLLEESRAPTSTELAQMAGGYWMLEQLDPLLPAAIAGKIPAARTASTIVWRVKVEQPSLGGHSHELLMESGALEGSPWPPLMG